MTCYFEHGKKRTTFKTLYKKQQMSCLEKYMIVSHPEVFILNLYNCIDERRKVVTFVDPSVVQACSYGRLWSTCCVSDNLLSVAI